MKRLLHHALQRASLGGGCKKGAARAQGVLELAIESALVRRARG